MANAKNLETVKLNKNSVRRRFFGKAEGMHLLTASEKRPKTDRTESEKRAWSKKGREWTRAEQTRQRPYSLPRKKLREGGNKVKGGETRSERGIWAERQRDLRRREVE